MHVCPICLARGCVATALPWALTPCCPPFHPLVPPEDPAPSLLAVWPCHTGKSWTSLDSVTVVNRAVFSDCEALNPASCNARLRWYRALFYDATDTIEAVYNFAVRSALVDSAIIYGIRRGSARRKGVAGA